MYKDQHCGIELARRTSVFARSASLSTHRVTVAGNEKSRAESVSTTSPPTPRQLTTRSPPRARKMPWTEAYPVEQPESNFKDQLRKSTRAKKVVMVSPLDLSQSETESLNRPSPRSHEGRGLKLHRPRASITAEQCVSFLSCSCLPEVPLCVVKMSSHTPTFRPVPHVMFALPPLPTYASNTSFERRIVHMYKTHDSRRDTPF